MLLRLIRPASIHYFNHSKLLVLSFLFLLSSCNPVAQTEIQALFSPGIYASIENSTLSVSSATVKSGESVTATLLLKDNNKNTYLSVNEVIDFSVNGGTSTVSIGGVRNLGDGRYTATLTGINSGTPLSIRAKINGKDVISTGPTLQVLPGDFSLTNSLLTLGSTSVTSGSSVVATLVVKDNSNNQLPSGGLSVTFHATNGSSTLTIGATTDNGNGTYSSVLTGITAGTATTISAKIAGLSIASTLPQLIVNYGPVSQLLFSTPPSSTGNTDSALSTQPVVRAVDVNNNTVLNFTGAITLSAYSDTSCTNQVTSSFTAASNPVSATAGLASFNQLKILKASVRSLKATDGIRSVCHQTLTISPGALSSITFSTSPAPLSTNTDTVLSTQPVITAYDAQSNVLANDSSSSVTLSAYDGSSCSGQVISGGLSGTTTVSLNQGIATFSNIKIVKTNVQSVKATLGSNSVCSSNFTVGAGAAASITIVSGNAQTAAHHTALSSPFIVSVKDANSNIISGASVIWAVTAGGGSLSATTSTTNSSGEATSSLTLGLQGANSASATVSGTALNVSFTATATTTALNSAWDFDLSSDYIVGTGIDFNNSYLRLTPNDQIDDDNSSSSGFGAGSIVSAIWDNTFLRINQTSNSGEHSASWTPQYANLAIYLKLNGTLNSTIATNTILSAAIGTNATAKTADATLPFYTGGPQNQGITFDGVDDYLDLGSNTAYDFSTNSFSLSLWINYTTCGANLRIFGTGSGGGSNGVHLRCNGGGALGFTLGAGGVVANAVDIQTLTTTYNDGAWHHIMVIGDQTNKTLRMFVDGQLSMIQNNFCGTKTADVVNFSACTSVNANRNGLVTLASHLGSALFFNGSLDEFALWNTPLTDFEVKRIYERQRTKYSGNFTSRVIDATMTSQNWTNLNWTSPLPYGKEIPAPTSGESTSSYPSISSTLTNGLAALWRFNEAAGTSGANSVLDRSGNNYHGTPSGTLTFGAQGRFGSALYDPGSNGYITIPTSALNFPGTASFSVSVWFRSSIKAGYLEFINARGTDANGGQGWILYLFGGGAPNGQVAFRRTINSFEQGTTSFQFNDGLWHHFVGTYDGTTMRGYFDGVESTSYTSTTPMVSIATQITIMSGSATSKGVVDELAIWSRALTPSEALSLYRRGSNRVYFQVRKCTSANAGLTTCTDDSNNINWVGADGTSKTYFSELNNNTTQATGSGSVKATSPSMTLSGLTGQYFQYRMLLESDDQSTACNYGAGATWCSPEISSVSLLPIRYVSTTPTMVTKNGISFYSLSGFSESSATCSSGLSYNLSLDKTNWYWWDSTANSGTGGWVLADGTVTKSNIATTVSSNAGSFSTQVGRGSLYVKAFLKSSGITSCEIDKLQVTGTQ